MTEEKTEYRIIRHQTQFAEKYLQFKSKRFARNFPDFWHGQEIECWRYIPTESTHVLGSLVESGCPTRIPPGMEACLISDSAEKTNSCGGLYNFMAKYTNINDYLKHFNSLIDEK